MNKKNKILLLGKLPPPYMGPAIATEIILNSRLSADYELIHLDTRMNKSVASMGKWSFKKAFKSINVYRRFWKLLKSKKPDLVLVPVSQTTLGFIKDAPFILLASFFKTKTVIQLRGSNFLNWLKGSSVFTRSFVKYTLKRVDGAIVLGQKLRYLFEPFLDKSQIFVVPNGANYDIPPSKWNGEELRVLYFANFLETKGFKDVLKAWISLNLPAARLVAAGAWDDPQYKASCMELIQSEEQNIEILGPQWGKKKWKLFSEADVFVFTPNAPEGHPWVIVEALAGGLPVISTDQGAIMESVMDGKNGFIVPPGSPEAIAQKIKILAEDEKLRNKMSKNSKSIYLENFTEEKMVENMATAFDALLKSKR